MTEAEKTVSVDAIKAAVCEHFHLRPVDMVSQRRSRYVARPRQLAMALASELTALSLPVIGRLFGNRDHTTVMHAIRRVQQDERVFFTDYVAIRAALKAG